ncbi:MAG: hypothetical protein ACRCXT_15460 [Paraclostridium sp.]
MIEEIAKIYGIETSKYGVHTLKKENGEVIPLMDNIEEFLESLFPREGA